MIRRLVLSVAVVAVLGSALAACSDSSKTITVGALYPRTGPQGAGGTEEFRGVELAADWANDATVAQGTRVKLAPVDAARAEQVPDAMDGLAARGVSIVLGSHGSAISAAAAREATAKKLAFFETGAVGQTAPDDSNGTNFFRLAPMGANLGRAAISFVEDQLAAKLPPHGPLRYGVTYVDDAYGRAVAQGALDTIKERGLTLAGAFAYDAHATDYGPLVARVAAARPDVLFAAAYVDGGVAVPPAAGNLRVPSVAKAALAVKLPQGSLANGGGLDLAPPGALDAGANRRSAGVIEEWVAPGKKATVWPPAFAERPVEALPLS